MKLGFILKTVTTQLSSVMNYSFNPYHFWKNSFLYVRSFFLIDIQKNSCNLLDVFLVKFNIILYLYTYESTS